MTARTQPHNLIAQLNASQRLAVDPASHIWLNASAGTGKTQVLSARVLRLLLDDNAPDTILCITFTKAGAAEMAHRIHERLALWVRCELAELRTDLEAIGVDPDDAELTARARTLFARVIDSPAGAIRVQTIHSFCQSLLASFPFEASILPGFRLIEEAEAAPLKRRVLAALLTDASEGARRRGWLARLSQRLGEKPAVAFAEKTAALFARRNAPALAPAVQDVRRAFGLPQGDPVQSIAAQLAEGAVSDNDVATLLAAAEAWDAATGQKYAAVCRVWLSADAMTRTTMLDDLRKCVFTQKGVVQAEYSKRLAAAADAAMAIGTACTRLIALPDQCALADDLAAGWQLGADFAGAWMHCKREHGYAEFDDLIAGTAALLSGGASSEWVRYKLDQRIDHLLIDEAQDTNADQWRIAGGISAEFFAGAGAREENCVPSMFTVGDRKQAIFGFQGTDPAAFESARQRFAALAEQGERPFVPADLTVNFRSGAAVLAFVDRWVADGGAAAMGIDAPVPTHEVYRGGAGPARVELWPPLIVADKDGRGEGAADDDDSDDGAGNGVSDESISAASDPASLKLAAALAERVGAWLDPDGPGIDGLAMRPDDVMILVRARGKALALRIVAQLQSRGVPVAGVDRFDLSVPLAVQDLLAALRFIVQPDDEYSLAALLVSPLIGWTQQELYDESGARGRTPLRQWLAQSPSARAVAAMERLELLRAEADFATPFRHLDTILSGPLQGRRALVARLGAEANDAIDALLAEALAFEARTVPSLIAFLDHIDRAPPQVKRQTDSRGGLVRVMTVHGAKGLQAPIVILADATRNPLNSDPDVNVDIAGWRGLPVFKAKAAIRPAPIEAAWVAGRQAQLAEHWRLFYVAATRAERLFIITGTLPSAEKPVPPDSWYAAAQQTLTALGAQPADVGWAGGPALVHRDAPGNWARRQRDDGHRGYERQAARLLPDWAQRPPPAEARPPRPLAPSQLGADDAPQPPSGAGRVAAIRRGVLMHALIERLPDVPPMDRMAVAERWLAAQAGDLAPSARAAMAAEASGVLAEPAWAALFGPTSLAEAPFSAVLPDGVVVAGTVDRLLVTDDAVLVVDYKTGAHVPGTAENAPAAYLRQMSAYAAALSVIFPGREVRAALLYTAVPRLIALPPALLALHKPGFADGKMNLPPPDLEHGTPNA